MSDQLVSPPRLRDIYKSEQFTSSDLAGKHAIIDRWSEAKKNYGIGIGVINSEEKVGIFDKKTAEQKELFSMAEQMDRMNEPGFIEERTNAIKRSFLSTASALEFQASKNATMEIGLLREEEDRLLAGKGTKVTQDPESMEGTVTVPLSHDEGMERLAEVQQRIGDIQNSGVVSAGVALEDKRAAATIPRSKGMQEFMEADGFAASAKAFKDNFAVVVMDAVLESSAAIVAPVAGGVIAGAPGAFTGGASVEFVHSFQEFIEEGAKEKGLDPNDAEQLFLAMADKELLDSAATRAMIRGGVIGSVDMFTMGMGALISKKLAGRAIAEPAARTGFNLVGDPAGGSAGELAAQLAVGQELDGKDIFLEGIGQFGTGAAGTVKDLGPKLPGAALKATGKAAVGTYRLGKGAFNAASSLYGKIKGSNIRANDPEAGPAPEPNAENPVTPQDWTLAYLQGRFENAGAWVTAMPGETAAELMPIVGISIDETNEKIADIVNSGNIEGNQELSDLQENLASMKEMMGALESALEEPEPTTAEPEPEPEHTAEPAPTVEPEPVEEPAPTPEPVVEEPEPEPIEDTEPLSSEMEALREELLNNTLLEHANRTEEELKAFVEAMEKAGMGGQPVVHGVKEVLANPGKYTIGKVGLPKEDTEPETGDETDVDETMVLANGIRIDWPSWDKRWDDEDKQVVTERFNGAIAEREAKLNKMLESGSAELSPEVTSLRSEIIKLRDANALIGNKNAFVKETKKGSAEVEKLKSSIRKSIQWFNKKLNDKSESIVNIGPWLASNNKLKLALDILDEEILDFDSIISRLESAVKSLEPENSGRAKLVQKMIDKVNAIKEEQAPTVEPEPEPEPVEEDGSPKIKVIEGKNENERNLSLGAVSSKMKLTSDGTVRFPSLVTETSSQRKGLGREFIKQGEQAAIKEFGNKVTGFAAIAFDDVVGFWEKLGYIKTGETALDGEAHVLRKELASGIEPGAGGAASRPAVPASQTKETAEESHGTVSSGKPNGAKVKFRYKVVEREDLEGMVVTEIGEDQTRNREDNRASTEQVEKIATGIDADLLSESSVATSGAPIVDTGTVISGNGRSLGIAEAYNRKLADGYKESVVAFAAEKGIDASGFNEPVLVREVQEFTSGTREQFVEESNPKRGGLGESVSEQALLDAKAIGEETLGQLTFTANGDLTADSLAAVARKLEEANRGVTRSTKGAFDKAEATRRVMASFLAKMVERSGREATEVSALLETDGGKRVVSAVASSSHKLSQMDNDLSLAGPLMDALMEFKSGTQAVSKRQFKNLEEWHENRKQELLASELDEIGEELLTDMVNGEIREGLGGYITEAQAEQKERDISRDTEDIFGDERKNQSAQTIFDKSRRVAEERKASEQDASGTLPGSESEAQGEGQIVSEDLVGTEPEPILEEEAPIDNIDPNEGPIHKFTLGAVVQLSKMLGLDPTVNPRLRNAYGRFMAREENGKIVPESVETAEGLFLDPVKALRTLAHEVGHFIDYTVAHAHRGTIPTKLAPLSKRNWAAIFPELQDQTIKQVGPAIEKEMAAEQQRQIDNVKAQKQFNDGANPEKLAAKIDKIKNSIAKQTAEKIAVASRVSMRATIKGEAIALSKAWRGDFSSNNTYRNSSAELYADFLSAILNNPAWVKKSFPNMHNAFFRSLDQKPTVNKAYQQLNDLLTGGGMTDFLMDKLDKNYDESIDHLFALSKTKEKNAKLASETKIARARRFFLNKWGAVTAKEGTILKGVAVDSYTSALEALEGYAAKTRSLFNDSMRTKVTEPLKEAGVSTKIFSRFLLLNRIVNDTTNTIEEIKKDPETYRKVMVWMAEQFGASQYVIDVINNTSDASLFEAGAIMVRELKINKKLTPEIVAKVEAKVANDGSPENDILEGAAERIMAGFNIRGFMLNTEGLDVPASIEGLEKMRAELGAKKWKAVKDSSAALFELTTEITETAISLGLYSKSTAEEVIRPNAQNYIPFQVIEYFSGDVSAAIKKGKGSTKALNDSLTAVSLHSQALMGWIQRQKTVLMLEKWAKDYGVEVTDSGPITSRKRKLGNDKKDVVLVWREGRPHELSFNEPGIAEAANYFEELTFITSLAKTAGNFFGQMFTRYSPGFILVTNPMRDFLTSAQGLGVRRSARNYKAAYKIAKAYAQVATGASAMTPEIRELVDKGVLPPPEQSIFNQMTEPEMRDMLNIGLSARDVAHGRVKATDSSKINMLKEWVDKPFTYAGAISESLPKIAASMSLAEMGFSEAETVKMAKLFGIPNPGLGGSGVVAMGAISLFYRVTIQGARMQRELLTNPKTRGGYFLRVAMIEMLPKIMMWTAQTGILAMLMRGIGIDPGDDLEMFYKSVSTYKKESGTVIPIGWVTPDGFKPVWGHSKDEIGENWLAFGLRIPQSEAGRAFGGAAWNSLAEFSDDTRSSAPVRTWARFAGNQLPGVNPAIDVVSKNAQAMMGINAIDSFRNRPIINYTDWNAGGMDRFKAMMKWNVTQFASSWINLDASVDVTGLSGSQKSVRKIPVVRSLFTFDNFSGSRERGLKISDNKKIASRAKKALGSKTLDLVNMGNRLEGIGVDGRSAAQQARYEVWLEFNRENWEGQKTGLMSDLKVAIADKNKQEIKEITEYLEKEAEIATGYIQTIK